ncbi:glutamate--tRNA ligase [Zhengella mangrovi]|uniref:Glutamate--tRNA ligase n=1 Tax=Zhengella mangrovi TaxID=1982044 RepID=A0A2G1QM29_9HYPH|nr:glutamate--tRNA ligase [Zhengella mangrovi]PHP66587.1 glutamate--tRNA ligase [Zhengella mangrovi]
MTVTVRFAPSPTGFIHIGNARTALFNWLFAQQRNGRFILRFDDTDTARSEQRFADQIEADLAWLGIRPDAVERQSERSVAHDAAAETLKAAGLLYPCYETAEELERRRKIRLSRRLPPVYGREALKLTADETAAFEAEGRKPHWRFLLPNHDGDPFRTRRSEVHWDDVIRGPQTVDLASMSDPVLVREDGSYLYTLPSVADDIAMGVTHVIRGDDHVTNTGAQIALFEALGGQAPAFGHHNLLTTASGEGLSKRSGALSVHQLAQAGYEPMSVASLAVLIGTSEAVRAVPDMDTLARDFVAASASKSAAKFDPSELDTLNAALVHEMDFAAVRDRLAAIGVGGEKAEAFWLAVRGNITRVPEAGAWWAIVTEGPDTAETVEADDLDFVRAAFDLLPPDPWDGTTWKTWTEAVKQASGRKGRGLFMPLRIAITGRRSGPELSDLMPLLGRAETLARRP